MTIVCRGHQPEEESIFEMVMLLCSFSLRAKTSQPLISHVCNAGGGEEDDQRGAIKTTSPIHINSLPHYQCWTTYYDPAAAK